MSSNRNESKALRSLRDARRIVVVDGCEGELTAEWPADLCSGPELTMSELVELAVARMKLAMGLAEELKSELSRAAKLEGHVERYRSGHLRRLIDSRTRHYEDAMAGMFKIGCRLELKNSQMRTSVKELEETHENQYREVFTLRNRVEELEATNDTERGEYPEPRSSYLGLTHGMYWAEYSHYDPSCSMPRFWRACPTKPDLSAGGRPPSEVDVLRAKVEELNRNGG